MKNHLQVMVVIMALCGFAPSTWAGMIHADFSFGWSGNHNLTGTLSGIDNDLDGILRFEELTAFNVANTYIINMSNLTDMGDIDIANQTWLPNAISWTFGPSTAFFTWNGRTNSCSTYNSCGADLSVNVKVPEPGSMALLVLGLIGLGIARFRQSKS